MAIDDGCEDAGQVAVRFDMVQFAGLNKRCEHRPVLGPGVVTGKECVLSLQGDGADRAFHGVAVHLDAAIAQEQDQPVPVLGDVFEGFASRGFCGYL